MNRKGKSPLIIPVKRIFAYRLTFLLVIFLAISFSACEKNGNNPIHSDLEVEALLTKMTIEEKAGQMTNIGLKALCEGEFYGGQDTVRFDSAKLYRLIKDYKIGSVQNLGKYPFTIEEWRYFINRVQEVAIKETRLGIPVLYAIDGVHGANYTAKSTLFPHQIGIAATWNPKMAEAMGRVTAYEVRASGITWNFGPSIDVSKQPLWGRIGETFGEDTYLTQVMGDAMLKGAQGVPVSGPYKVAACPKHFLGYGTPFNGKDRSSVFLPERILRQTYLPPFQSAVEKGALSIMLNSGAVNGIPCHADKYLVTDVLKGELGFTGVVVSDWGDIMNLVDVHRVAKDEREAVKMTVNAGMDMCMEPYDESFAVQVVELVNDGEIPMSRIDDAVRRILTLKKKLGLFERIMYPEEEYPDFGSGKFAEEAFQAGLESMTLLKNENSILPLSKNKRVFVTGVGANSMNYLNGPWSRTFLGQETDYNDEEKLTVLEAIQSKLGAGRVTYSEGTDYTKDINTGEAVRKAGAADVIIACLGEQPATEKPSDIEDLAMPEAQRDLIKALHKTGKSIVLVLLEGRPRVISDIEPLVDGILMAYYPGNEGGRAIANVLFGDYNPNGKLPYTYPRHTGSIWSYDHTLADERDVNWGFNAFSPQYEFGHGLSYTTFAYSDLQWSQEEMTSTDSLVITVQVTNTGNFAGKEVVQLYLADKVASISPAVKQLKKFEKIFLEPGGSKTVRFVLAVEDLEFVDRNNQWVAEPGEFEVMVVGLSGMFRFIE